MVQSNQRASAALKSCHQDGTTRRASAQAVGTTGVGAAWSVMADKQTHKSTPKTDDVSHVAPLSGLDRSGLGEKGWAEVPEDRIGGHPELETVPDPCAGGGLNGPQPEMDPKTGAVRQHNS